MHKHNIKCKHCDAYHIYNGSGSKHYSSVKGNCRLILQMDNNISKGMGKKHTWIKPKNTGIKFTKKNVKLDSAT